MRSKNKLAREESDSVPDYVYTMEAARGRLNRGAKSVLVFLPCDGRLMKVTKKNWKGALKQFNHSEKYGTA